MDFLKKDASFEIIKGNKCIMFSAPHAVEQLREGSVKMAEPSTGIIAKKLAEQGYSAIVKKYNNNDDANYDSVSEYKTQLKKYIEENKVKYLFDLHELSPARTMDVCIGTGRGRNIFDRDILVEIVKKNLARYNIENITVDEPFAASYENTVSAFTARECNIPAIQIEINSGLFIDNDEWIDVFVRAFDDISKECINL